jgi:hypothetical protein
MDTALTISVGRVHAPVTQAAQWLRRYTDEVQTRLSAKPFAFPAYDRFHTGTQPGELNDGDLLAPVLLNVGIGIRSFYGLQTVRSRLEAALGDERLDTPLVAAPDDLIERRVSEIYRILDDPKSRPYGVSGTKLSKIVHRKRPAFLVLHDRWVRACYVGNGAPVPNVEKQSWADYMVILTKAIRADLITGATTIAALREEIPSVGELSDVRVLDILAWNAGQRLRP